MQSILQEIMKKNNTWNIRRLVDELFVPATQRPSILYGGLSDFWLVFPKGDDPLPHPSCLVHSGKLMISHHPFHTAAQLGHRCIWYWN